MPRAKSFWVYPDPQNPYWKLRFHLYPSRKKLQAVWEKNTGKKDTQIDGYFQSCKVTKYHKDGTVEPIGEFGELSVAHDTLTAEVVVHECGHAAHEYCRRRRKNRFHRPKTTTGSVAADEEVYCYALGEIADQILARLFLMGYRFGAIK